MRADFQRGGPGGGGRPGYPGRGPRQDTTSFSVDCDKILAGDAEAIVRDARALAQAIQEVKPAQIRNFYGPIVRIAESAKRFEDQRPELILLLPRLHYMSMRERKLEPLARNFEMLIERTTDQKHLRNLYRFAEAVVAYAKKGD